jgi:hypothetical protein
MTPRQKRLAVVSDQPSKLPVRSNSPDTSLISASPQQIVTRFRNTLSQLDRLPVLEGEPGALLLEALEYTDKIRDAIRARMREAIYESPGLVPGWRVEERTVLSLCRDKGGQP